MEYLRVEEGFVEGIIGFGQAECRREDIPDRREDIPDRRNNQGKERGVGMSRGVGSVRTQACRGSGEGNALESSED